MATPERDKEGFTLVDRKRQKKRKAKHSPLFHTPPGCCSASSSGSPTCPKPSHFNYPNTVPVIFRDADPKFTSVKEIMSELSQYHPELRVSRVKDLPNKGFFIIGNTPRDVIIQQKKTKMKACLGKNLMISLPKAFQNKDKSKTLVVKGVPTKFTNDEFKQVLYYNSVGYAWYGSVGFILRHQLRPFFVTVPLAFSHLPGETFWPGCWIPHFQVGAVEFGGELSSTLDTKHLWVCFWACLWVLLWWFGWREDQPLGWGTVGAQASLRLMALGDFCCAWSYGLLASRSNFDIISLKPPFTESFKIEYIKL